MYHIRPLQRQDNPEIARIIREVSKEFGLSAESGFAVADLILDDLYEFYGQQHSQYWVIENQSGQIFGGGGLSPLKGDASFLEIQKMYFLPEIRGLGLAKQLLEKAFHFTQDNGFESCYLESTATLGQAVKLYEKFGFQYLAQPKGQTGHSHVCEIWMEKRF
jgi:putative acetyltransferase